MFHAKSFEEYAATRVIPARISRARKLMQVHAALLGRIERQFGVPAPVIVAVWTLESDNGTGDMGKLPVIRTVATSRMTAAAPSYSSASLSPPCRSSSAAICRYAISSAPMPARSARQSLCLRRTSSTASTTTAAAISICAIPFQMCWPRPPICSRPMAGRRRAVYRGHAEFRGGDA